MEQSPSGSGFKPSWLQMGSSSGVVEVVEVVVVVELVEGRVVVVDVVVVVVVVKSVHSSMASAWPHAYKS